MKTHFYIILFILFPLSLFCQIKEVSNTKVKVDKNVYVLRNTPLNGKFKVYHKRNRDKAYSITNFKNGIKNDSMAVEYYFGETKTGNYQNGLKEGKWVTKSKDGNIIETSEYKKGTKNGYTIVCKKDNSINDTIHYKNDKIDGWEQLNSRDGFSKTLYKEGEIQKSFSKRYDHSFFNEAQFFKIYGKIYYSGKKIRYEKGKKFTDSSIINYHNGNIIKTVYSKINDTPSHTIEIIKKADNDRTEIKFYNKKNIIYMKYNIVDLRNETKLFSEENYYLSYDEEKSVLKVKLSNSCDVWEEIGKIDFEAITYDDNKENVWQVHWIPSDGDMLADKCLPNLKNY